MLRPICVLIVVAICSSSHVWSQAKVHVVKGGETLSQIALRHKVSVAKLRRWNNISGDKIMKGQRLDLWTSAPPTRYTVKRGDTLFEIAARFGLSVSKLRKLNGLRGDRILPGKKLSLKARAPAKPVAAPKEIKADKHVVSAPRKPIPEATVPLPETLVAIPTHHVVKKGDTLSEIARKYRIRLSDLKSRNKLKGDVIKLGQRLKLPKKQPAAENQPDQRARKEDEPRHYVVKKGDTLSEIARRFEMPLNFLRQLNKMQGDRIHPGQKLKLRPEDTDEGIHIVRTGETLSAIAMRYKVPLGSLRELNGIEGSRILVGQKLRLKQSKMSTHIVEKGDALWEIARAYDMTVQELQQLNGLRSTRIYPGQELRLNGKKAPVLSSYRVKGGDYLGEIARLHQMSVAELRKLNDLKGPVIHPGDLLKVRPLLGAGKEWLKISEIDWNGLRVSLGGVTKFESKNGPYYYQPPRISRQKGSRYYEEHPRSPMRTYKQARKLWRAFEREVMRLGRLSKSLEGWHVVLDPGHGGLDPGAIVPTLDGNGTKLYVVEDEYVYDIAMRVYVLLRLHGADVTMTVLSPNHLIRRTRPPANTFVHQKNEVYNSFAVNKPDTRKNWPRGGNLNSRVRIAEEAFANTPAGRRIFLSFHADNDANSPEAPLALYYESRDGRRQDLASRDFARAMLPALGAGSRTRGQPLGVLRDNPAKVKLLLELRNLAYTNNAWSLRFEQYRHRDAEKITRGVLDFVRRQRLTAGR